MHYAMDNWRKYKISNYLSTWWIREITNVLEQVWVSSQAMCYGFNCCNRLNSLIILCQP